MAKYERLKSATEWLELSPLEREYYKPKRMTKEEMSQLMEEEDFVSALLYKKELVDRQRLKWALTHTSWEKKYKFIEEFGDPDYKGNFKGQLKNALVRYMQQDSSAGEINNVGWYLNAAYASDVDYETLQSLDALARVLTHDELQQLYHDLPSIQEFYPTKGGAHAEEQGQMWTEALEDTIEKYRDMLEKEDKGGKKSRIKQLHEMLDIDDPEEW